MKNKRTLLAILSIAIAIAAMLGLCACNNEAHEHSFSSWETITEPTCTAPGFQKRTCECSYTEYETIATVAHTPVTDAAVEATCTAAGKTEGSHCGVCKAVIVAQTDVAPLDHTFSAWETVTAATCTSFGLEKRTCECDYTEYKATDALAHTFSAWQTVTAATCTSSGLEKRTCKCSYAEYNTTLALQHTPVTDEAVGATCTTAGKTAGSHCGVCKAVIVAQTDVAPLAHTFSAWQTVTAATCTSFGLEKRTCECSYAEYNTTLALQHTPVTDAAVDATCTTDGTTAGSHCGSCGTILTVQTVVPAFGHKCDNVTVITEADCYEEGCKRFACTNDGCSYYYDESYSKDEVSAPEIMASAMQYTGVLQTYTSSDVPIKFSTAFVISSDGLIVTAYRVLNQASYATFTLGDHTYYIDTILAYSEKTNLAVLKIDATDLVAAPICQQAPVTGEKVYAVGNALDLSMAINEGVISNANLPNGDSFLIQHDAVLMSGYGGGPLFNRFGEVIGVNYGYYEDEHFRLSMPISDLATLDFDKPISMQENFELTYTTEDYIKEWIQVFSTTTTSSSYYFEHIASSYVFAFGYNEARDYIFLEARVALSGNYQVSVHIPLVLLADGTYQYQAVYTDGTYKSEIAGFFDPATFADPTNPGSYFLTYDTFYGRYWAEDQVMDACSYATYESLGWLSYVLDTYFFDVTLKDTFGFTAFTFERDESALEKLNEYLKANGTYSPSEFEGDRDSYGIAFTQDVNNATLFFDIVYHCATETEEAYTSVMITARTTSGAAYSVAITLDSTETGNMIMMMYADMTGGYNIVNAAWGYIDANSFTDKSEIFCYMFDGMEEYEDALLLTYSSMIPYLMSCVNYVMDMVEPGLNIRDLGFFFYFLG